MKNQKLQPSQIVELLTPLVDFNRMEQCSISCLKADPGSVSKKIGTSGAPIRLTHNGMTIAIMCDPRVYVRVEERRRGLVAILENAPCEFNPTVRRRTLPFARPNIQELKWCIAKIEQLHRQINLQKCHLYDLEEELQETAEKERKLIPGIKSVRLPAA